MRRSLAIIGGGLAGIAAAETAVQRGFKVDLFEWSRVLGGRAASVFDPVADDWLDNGQHVALGCCKEFLALNTRLGLSDFFEQKNSIPFAQTDGKHWVIAPTSFLPESWQLLPAFLRIPLLTLRQRISTVFALRKLGKSEQNSNRQKNSQQNNLSDDFFAKWLKSENVSSKCIEKFWEPLILSSLCDTVDNVAFDAVQKVVRDGFMTGQSGLTIHIPKKPLRTIYHDKTSEKLKSIGVNLHFLSRVTSLRWEFLSRQDHSTTNHVCPNNNDNNDNEHNPTTENDDDNLNVTNKINDEADNNSNDNDNNDDKDQDNVEQFYGNVSDDVSGGTDVTGLGVVQPDQSSSKIPVVTGLEFSDGVVRSFDRYILAVPAFRAREILEASELETFSDSLGLAGFEPGAITSVHLWLSRRLLPDDYSHSALVGGIGQFLFCTKSIESRIGGFYHVVLISASHRILSELELASAGATILVERVMQQLESTFKNDNKVNLLHHRVTTYFEAVFSPHPLVYSHRPVQKTPFINFSIAGDWTQTGWPSTLEGAVRSGLLAVDSIDYDNNIHSKGE
ncbi:MAG: FAD-dependent oxidoreductase [Planctomycetaceae bacterium]|jgi:predicted NAD/FAD-binding protein|nr:FAD-dependent oxidoreductase [Planctomycetaceae bacterium]